MSSKANMEAVVREYDCEQNLDPKRELNDATKTFLEQCAGKEEQEVYARAVESFEAQWKHLSTAEQEVMHQLSYALQHPTALATPSTFEPEVLARAVGAAPFCVRQYRVDLIGCFGIDVRCVEQRENLLFNDLNEWAHRSTKHIKLGVAFGSPRSG
eukprot:252200-Amphidinium_carterae.1